MPDNAVIMLIFQIKRLNSSQKRLNYVVPFFLLEMPKYWVCWTKVNGVKRGWSIRIHPQAGPPFK